MNATVKEWVEKAEEDFHIMARAALQPIIEMPKRIHGHFRTETACLVKDFSCPRLHTREGENLDSGKGGRVFLGTATQIPNLIPGSRIYMQKTKECLFAEIEETLKQLNKSRVPETFIIEQAEIFRSGLPFQIAESAQVDVKNPDQKSILASPTHFNPVDLVCGVSEFQGECLDLRAFSNKSMGFITIKSKDGKELKALELPGLWNGGMDLWNTVFIEVPSSTFTPAKTVLDLLWPEHRPWATLVRRGRSCYVRKILHC